MEYLVKIPFATLKRSYSTGEIIADLEDAKNLLASGIVEMVHSEKDGTDESAAEKPKKVSKK